MKRNKLVHCIILYINKKIEEYGEEMGIGSENVLMPLYWKDRLVGSIDLEIEKKITIEPVITYDDYDPGRDEWKVKSVYVEFSGLENLTELINNYYEKQN